MSSPGADDRNLPDALEYEAQRALKERPSFSIRARITLGFLLWFILSLGITIASLVILSRIQNKLLFMESASNYTFEIQQARRFEKNYFLYRTNLGDALEHVHQARSILENNSAQMAAVVGQKQFDTMRRHVERYEDLMERLSDLDKERGRDPPNYDAIESELRTHGAEMVAVAEQLVAKERQSVNYMLLMSKRIPIVFLAVLLVLMIYLANFITRQMMRPLNRLMAATSGIADGDFTPITPSRRYRDEFSELAMAMNHMMRQLVHRHELLVQAHKLKAVGTLTAGVAHELNNPINNIMLTSAMLQEDYKTLSDDERLDMISDLLNQAERSQRIVRNLLDFARESEIRTDLFQAGKLLDDTVALANNQIRLARVKVSCSYAPNLPPLHGDQQQLTQVFLNLILNALDAMPGGGALTITTSNSREPDFLEVAVTDTGTGIPEHVLPNIFDPFFTMKPTGKGTGLGLSVSLGIVQKHGGDIRVTSQPNKGSTFTVLLPIAKIPARMSPEDGSGGKN